MATILGIDPGYAIVGYGVINNQGYKSTAVTYGAVTTGAKEVFENRLEKIYNEVSGIIKKFSPQSVAIEKLYFQNNQKTAIDVAQARGVTMLAIKKSGVPVFEYTPLQVKMAITGYGRADKRQMMEMTRKILGLENIPKPDDAADALAIAICHSNLKFSKGVV